jgi:hypothetical protein
VTEGDLFAEGTKVKMVFIDGQKYEERVAPDPASDEEESGGKP